MHRSGYTIAKGQLANALERIAKLEELLAISNTINGELIATNEVLSATINELEGSRTVRKLVNTANRGRVIEPMVGMRLSFAQLPAVGEITDAQLHVGQKVYFVKAKHTDKGMSVLDLLHQKALQTFGVDMDKLGQATAKLPDKAVAGFVSMVALAETT